MRIPKAYLINGQLLLIAIASWAAFLHQNSPERRRAEAEALSATFLNKQLPQNVSEVRLSIRRSDGTNVEVFPLPIGRKIVPSEMKQIKALAHFYLAIASARNTVDHRGWRTLGEAHLEPAVGSTVTLQVYETPDRSLGFQHGTRYYQVEGNASEVLMDFIHDSQNAEG